MLQCKPLGDCGIRIQFSEKPDMNTIQTIYMVKSLIEQYKEQYAITECIAASTSLSIYYNPTKVLYHELVDILQELTLSSTQKHSYIPRRIEIPACYHPDLAPDLLEMARLQSISVDRLIELHTAPTYFIYMIGFLPGFPYMLGLPSELATPRLATPRAKVAAGSIGIAGEQSGIYPIDSPGGWRIIARTPLSLYDPQMDPPFLLSAGSTLRFVPISLQEYTEYMSHSNKRS